MPAFRDLTGMTYNWLTVKAVASMNPVRWLCECRCGKLTSVVTGKLTAGHTKSCGCYQKSHPPRRTHGDAKKSGATSEYGIWQSMRNRCHLPTACAYKDYGARGIVVCDRWRHDYAAFLADMGRRPSSKHQLDRINNDGPYSPENCRWATAKVNTNNTRANVRVFWNGKTKTVAEWADELGVPRRLIAARLRKGWSPDEAFTLKPEERSAAYYEANGTRRRLHEWASVSGVKECTILARLKRGWSVERAVSAPIMHSRWS